MTSVRQASKSRAPSARACLRSAMPILRTTGGARSCASQAPSMELAADPRACPVSLMVSHPHSMGFLTWGCVAMVLPPEKKFEERGLVVPISPWQPVVALTSSPVRRPRRAAICHTGSLRSKEAEVSPSAPLREDRLPAWLLTELSNVVACRPSRSEVRHHAESLPVVLSAAKDLIAVCHGHEIPRFAP